MPRTDLREAKVAESNRKTKDDAKLAAKKQLEAEQIQARTEAQLLMADLAKAVWENHKSEPNLRPYGCTKCNYMFEGKSAVTAHHNNEHFRGSKKGSEICAKCGNPYEIVGKLRGTHKCPQRLWDNYGSRLVLEEEED